MAELLTDETALKMAEQILNIGPGGLLDVGIAANLLRIQKIAYLHGQVAELQRTIGICDWPRALNRLNELREKLNDL